MRRGRNVVCPDVRKELFGYFVDVRFVLKGRLPYSILVARAKQIYEEYCELKKQLGEEPELLRFS